MKLWLRKCNFLFFVFLLLEQWFLTGVPRHPWVPWKMSVLQANYSQWCRQILILARKDAASEKNTILWVHGLAIFVICLVQKNTRIHINTKSDEYLCLQSLCLRHTSFKLTYLTWLSIVRKPESLQDWHRKI